MLTFDDIVDLLQEFVQKTVVSDDRRLHGDLQSNGINLAMFLKIKLLKVIE